LFDVSEAGTALELNADIKMGGLTFDLYFDDWLCDVVELLAGCTDELDDRGATDHDAAILGSISDYFIGLTSDEQYQKQREGKSRSGCI